MTLKGPIVVCNGDLTRQLVDALLKQGTHTILVSSGNPVPTGTNTSTWMVNHSDVPEIKPETQEKPKKVSYQEKHRHTPKFLR